jgi:hypothetical protein
VTRTAAKVKEYMNRPLDEADPHRLADCKKTAKAVV